MESSTLSVIFLKFPRIFLTFWYFEAPKNLANFFLNLLSAFEHFFSLSLILKTLFRPWKNETRKGYVFYAIGIAMSVRILLFLIGIAILLAIFLFGVYVILFWLALPILSIFLIFYPQIIYG